MKSFLLLPLARQKKSILRINFIYNIRSLILITSCFVASDDFVWKRNIQSEKTTEHISNNYTANTMRYNYDFSFLFFTRFCCLFSLFSTPLFGHSLKQTLGMWSFAIVSVYNFDAKSHNAEFFFLFVFISFICVIRMCVWK